MDWSDDRFVEVPQKVESNILEAVSGGFNKSWRQEDRDGKSPESTCWALQCNATLGWPVAGT